ncbi:MAG: hypothetical protein HY019_11255 [Aquabacterium sp.]|uniref:hypothetical protein n=1 Tax=Aquabacterium sp. TaxID=1872578 RepID=UPI0025B99CF3|nr:hypothetical protein [Aquabacterium sp.]MBI3382573.1 hypothetical protein [Aquabacterium sp.]
MNEPTMFITCERGRASSLYYISHHWVIRCSGHTDGERVATTFIRRRPIEYQRGNLTSHIPAIGYEPIEGGHTGHPIVQILGTGYNASQLPLQWVSASGVSWAVAVKEIDEAVAYAQKTQYERASRVVGDSEFIRD